MINIEKNLNSTKGAKTKCKIEKLTVVKHALGFFNNEEILHILKPAKKKYKDLFGIKAGHYKIFFYLKNLYANIITKNSDYSILDEVNSNYLEILEKFEDIDIDEFEDAFYFFLQHVKNIDKKSIIRIRRIDKFLLRFLKNKFNDEKHEFTFNLWIIDNLIPKNSPEIAEEEVTNYLVKESKKVREIYCDFDEENNSLLKLAEILINSNSEKLEKIRMIESMMYTINITGNLTNLKIFKCFDFPDLPKDISPEKFEDNLMKMPNLFQLATMLPMRSSVFNKDKNFELLVSGEFYIINIVSEDFTLFFRGMPKLEKLKITFPTINNNTIKDSVFKINILQIFSLQNLKELNIELDNDTNNNPLLKLSEFIKECKMKHLESLKINFKMTNDYYPIILMNFKDFILKNKTVKNFYFSDRDFDFDDNQYFYMLPVFEIDCADQIVFDLCLELLKRKNNNKPITIEGSLGSIYLLFKAIVDNNSLCLFQYIDRINLLEDFDDLPDINEDELAKVFSCAMKEMTNLRSLDLQFTDINCKYLCNLIEIKQPLKELSICIDYISTENRKAFFQMFTKTSPVDTLSNIHILSYTFLINDILSILTDCKLATNLIHLKWSYCNIHGDSKECDLTVLENFFKSKPYLNDFYFNYKFNNNNEIKELCKKYNIKSYE